MKVVTMVAMLLSMELKRTLPPVSTCQQSLIA